MCNISTLLSFSLYRVTHTLFVFVLSCLVFILPCNPHRKTRKLKWVKITGKRFWILMFFFCQIVYLFVCFGLNKIPLTCSRLFFGGSIGGGGKMLIIIIIIIIIDGDGGIYAAVFISENDNNNNQKKKK